LQIILSAVEELNSNVDLRTLPERALTAASKVIAADSVAFTGISYSGEYAGIGWENSDAIAPADVEIFTQYMHEQPLFDAYVVKRRTETLKITDLISPEEFKRTNIYNEFYRRVGVTNQLVAPMQISKDFLITCSINTITEDFSERDRLILTLIAPHFANAIRNSFAYERLSSALDSENCGVVAVSEKAKPIFISELARRLFKKYFSAERHETDTLPETLRNWIKQIDLTIKKNEFDIPPMPLRITNQSGELSVRFAYNTTTRERTLILEEKKFISPKMIKHFHLTRREAEILFWIMQGKTDDVIATLCGISLRTVQKHVEHIYTKMGVENRTSAMLKILDSQ
jgi:DNA-binding CsgD family transcriptional regulator